MTWIYERTDDNKARFVLGEPGENNLICFGINPSTAEPGNLDPTLTRVKKIAQLKGYDGWIMLNVYPQRATNPNDMDSELNAEYHQLNTMHIYNVFREHKGTAWAAWGTLINKRPYLQKCLDDINRALWPYCSTHNWVTMGRRSKDGHPHHPLYLKLDSAMDYFDVGGYLNR
jgi:hypothetical protein